MLRVIRIGQADTAESTVLYVPSLAAVVTGGLAYNPVHMMTAETETGETERAQWLTNLDEVAALKPTFVAAAHKEPTPTTIRRSLGNPSDICGISPRSPPRRSQRPISSPGWSNAIPIGTTSAPSGIPRDQPSRGRTARRRTRSLNSGSPSRRPATGVRMIGRHLTPGRPPEPGRRRRRFPRLHVDGLMP